MVPVSQYSPPVSGGGRTRIIVTKTTGYPFMDPTREYFDKVADQWDDMRAGVFRRRVRRASIEAARVGPGMVVADVGSCTGFLAELALDAGARVIGIDISDGMLAQVTSRFAGRPFKPRPGTRPRCRSRRGKLMRSSPTWSCTTPRIRLHRSARWRGRSSRAAPSSSPTPIPTRTSGCGPSRRSLARLRARGYRPLVAGGGAGRGRRGRHAKSAPRHRSAGHRPQLRSSSPADGGLKALASQLPAARCQLPASRFPLPLRIALRASYPCLWIPTSRNIDPDDQNRA